MISENLQSVKNNIEKAIRKAGRKEAEVTLVAVSKTKPVSMLWEAYNEGVRDFGENKVQELVEKYEALPKDIRWHMIGHLQTNKVKYIIDKVWAIHSVDSLKLALVISKEAVKHNKVMNIFLEVNAANEPSKFGVSPKELPQLVHEVMLLPNIHICGLMTVAPYVEEAEQNRQYFAILRQLSVDIDIESIDNNYDGLLSMGMSGDYEVAIEEGANFVRVGTGVFGNRVYKDKGEK